jgi:hypothetical protein
MTTSCTDWNHPYYELLKKSKENELSFFGNHPEKMNFVSLGELFDFISWGGMNSVAYELNTKGLITLTQKWIKNQKPKIEYKEIPGSFQGSYTSKEVSREYFYLWNKFNYEEDVELPRIKHSECPRDKMHKRTIKDRLGRTRCAEVNSYKIKPSFSFVFEELDKFSAKKKINYLNNEPQYPTPDEWVDEEGEELDYSQEFEEYEKELERYKKEGEERVINPCYAIIKEPSDRYIKLESLFDRLNCSSQEGYTLHPFSGFTLANFVRAWWEQPGRKKIWRKKGEYDFYKAFPNFKPYSSDD